MLDDGVKSKVVESWKLVVPFADTAADLFYDRLFELRPEYRALFPEDLAAQKRKLVATLGFVVKSLGGGEDRPGGKGGALVAAVSELGRRHAQVYRIPEDSYEPVGQALLDTLSRGLGAAFDEETREAWSRTYGFLVATMKAGATAPAVAV
jgi:hemoglobin-like flavoprotein